MSDVPHCTALLPAIESCFARESERSILLSLFKFTSPGPAWVIEAVASRRPGLPWASSSDGRPKMEGAGSRCRVTAVPFT